jgi:hypothetical protein
MLFNHLLGIFCSYCREYKDPYTGVFINVICDDSVTCEKGHLLGYTWDSNWENFWKDE